jgi:hypothetical protein
MSHAAYGYVDGHTQCTDAPSGSVLVQACSANAQEVGLSVQNPC